MVETKLLRVVQDKEGWGEWAWRLISENPGKAIVAAPVVAGFAILDAPVALAGGAVVGGLGAAYDWWTGTDRIDEMPASKALTLQDENGAALEVSKVYARHPLRKTYPTTVISADKFHGQMVSEQMADIARFIKGHVPVRTLRITVSSSNGAKLDGSVTSSAKEAGIKGHFNAVVHHELFQVEQNPVVTPYDEEPYWIQQFPELRAAMFNASKGVTVRTIESDTSFGLSASVAQQAGINADWLSKQLFRIEATYG